MYVAPTSLLKHAAYMVIRWGVCTTVTNGHHVTGHLFGQLEGTLTPAPSWACHEDHINWFWLSGGSVTPDIVHRLRYKLAHGVCVVHSISLELFEAGFHQVSTLLLLTSAMQ